MPITLFAPDKGVLVVERRSDFHGRFNLATCVSQRFNRAHPHSWPVPVVNNKQEGVSERWQRQSYAIVLITLLMRSIKQIDIELSKRSEINCAEVLFQKAKVDFPAR
jgi:hypothetical protein